MSSVFSRDESQNDFTSWLEQLSPDEKLDIIMRLSHSLKSSKAQRAPSKLSKLYGAWAGGDSAETMIENLRNARRFTRERESY